MRRQFWAGCGCWPGWSETSRSVLVEHVTDVTMGPNRVSLGAGFVNFWVACLIGIWVHFVPCLWWTCDWGDGDREGIRGAIWFGLWIVGAIVLSLSSMQQRVAWIKINHVERVPVALAKSDADALWGAISGYGTMAAGQRAAAAAFHESQAAAELPPEGGLAATRPPLLATPSSDDDGDGSDRSSVSASSRDSGWSATQSVS